MILNQKLISKLSQKIGQDVCTPAGATVLQLDMEMETGIPIGLNTVKRLVGVLNADGITPRKTTLNAIAYYLGYTSWEKLIEKESNISSFGGENPFVYMSDIKKNANVEVCWEPNRRIIINHLGEGLYRVVESHNSKLMTDDLLSLKQLAVGFPFIASNVIRKDEKLGFYQAAESAGITRLMIL